jgi:hypothetical protein
MLERDGVLELEDPAESAWWPTIGNDETVLEINQSRLFPSHPPLDRGHEDYVFYGDEWDLDEAQVRDILGSDESHKAKRAVSPAQRGSSTRRADHVGRGERDRLSRWAFATPAD